MIIASLWVVIEEAQGRGGPETKQVASREASQPVHQRSQIPSAGKTTWIFSLKKKKKDEELKKFVPPFVLPLHYIPFLSSSISLLTEKPGREREKVKETPQSEKTYVCLEKAQCPMLRSSWRRVVPKPFLHHPHCMRSSVLLSLCSIFILENEIKSG